MTTKRQIRSEITKSERLGEEVHSLTLANGLPVLVLPKKGYLRNYAIYAVRYGSIDNAFWLAEEGELVRVPEGIAHFLEHKLFEDAEGNVFELFSENGASCNAYTSYCTTAYLFRGTNHFFRNLHTLLRFVNTPYFTAGAIEREKAIIAHEIRMWDDSPEYRIFMNLMEGLYHVNPVRVDISGTVESISRIRLEDLDRCYRIFYQPENMVLCAAGDLDPNRVFDEVERFFEGISQREAPEHRRHLPEEPPEANRARTSERHIVSLPKILIGFKDSDVGCRGRELLKKDIEISFSLDLIFGRSSDFYTKYYEQGLIDYSFSAYYSGEETHGYTVIGGETEEPGRLRDAVHSAIEATVDGGIREDDFLRIKNKAVGKYIKKFNSVEFIANSLVSSWFHSYGIFEYLSVLETVTAEDVQARLARHFQKEGCSESVLFPVERKPHGSTPREKRLPEGSHGEGSP